MKKRLIAAFALSLAMFLLSGCVAEPFAPTSTAVPSTENTSAPSASASVGETAPASSTPTTTAAYEEMTFGGYIYYSDPGSDTENGYRLQRRNIETNATEVINFTTAETYSFGDNRYADVSVSDDSLYPDWYDVHQMTCKIDKDGKIQKLIGGDAKLVQNNNSLYYTVYGESCIFKSELDCSFPVRIPVTPAGDEDPFKALSLTAKGKLTPIIYLNSIEDGYINVGYDIINEQCQCCFSADYKVFLSDHHIEGSYPGRYYDNRIYKDAWLYYLDLGNPVESDDSEEPLFYIHRMNKDGGEDKDLKVLCYSFEFSGQYLYTDTNITYGDFGHWDTYRYNLDGKEEKKIKYSDMTRFSKGDRLYFSLFDECAFYSATTACTKVKKIEVKIPDNKKIKQKLGYNYECTFITVTGEKDGWVYFEFKVTDTGPETYYTGEYRMNLKSRKVEKVDKGEYSLGEEEEED